MIDQVQQFIKNFRLTDYCIEQYPPLIVKIKIVLSWSKLINDINIK